MSPSSSKRKTRKAGREETSEGTSSKDTREIESLTDQDFEDLSNKIERNLSKRLKEQDDARECLQKGFEFQRFGYSNSILLLYRN